MVGLVDPCVPRCDMRDDIEGVMAGEEPPPPWAVVMGGAPTVNYTAAVMPHYAQRVGPRGVNETRSWLLSR